MKKQLRAYQRAKAYSPRRTHLSGVEVTEGETIERKVRRLMISGDPIKDGAPEIFTERNQGVVSAYNIRTDRWELATETMDVVAKTLVAAREDKGKVIEMKTDKDGGAESIQGTTETS